MDDTILGPDSSSVQSMPEAIGKTLAERGSVEDYDAFLSALEVPDTFAVRHATPGGSISRPVCSWH